MPESVFVSPATGYRTAGYSSAGKDRPNRDPPPSAGASTHWTASISRFTSPSANSPTLTAVSTPTAGPSKQPHVTPTATPMPEFEDAVLTQTNAARAQAHCAPLRMDPKLLAVARLHSADMAQNDYFNHNSPDGHDPGQRM